MALKELEARYATKRAKDYKLADGGGLQPISQNTMIYACYRMGYRGRQTVHGFRGLASTWANEAECYRSDWIEMALAHVDRDDVRSAYNSALYLTPRRRMLGGWAEVVAGMINGAHEHRIGRRYGAGYGVIWAVFRLATFSCNRRQSCP